MSSAMPRRVAALGSSPPHGRPSPEPLARAADPAPPRADQPGPAGPRGRGHQGDHVAPGLRAHRRGSRARRRHRRAGWPRQARHPRRPRPRPACSRSPSTCRCRPGCAPRCSTSPARSSCARSAPPRSTPPRAVASTPRSSSSSCSPPSPAPPTPCSASASAPPAWSTATAPCAPPPTSAGPTCPCRRSSPTRPACRCSSSNDSDAAIQAELSASPGSEDMVLVHVGRGVGCGIVTGGRRVSGAHHAAGEIGHVTVGTDGGEDCPLRQARLPRDLAVDPPAARARSTPPTATRSSRPAASASASPSPRSSPRSTSPRSCSPGPRSCSPRSCPSSSARSRQRLLADPDAPLSVRLAGSPRGHRPARRSGRGPLGPTRGRLDPDHELHPCDARTGSTSTTRTTHSTTHHHPHLGAHPGADRPHRPKGRPNDSAPALVALTSAALVLTACANGGDSSDTPAATSSTSNAGKTITLWLAGGDTPDELRTYLQRHVQGQDRRHPQDRGAGLGRPRHQADHRRCRTPRTPLTSPRSATPSRPTFTNVGAFLDISDMYDGARRRQAAASPSSRSARSTARSTRCPTTSARATCSTARTSGRRPASHAPTTLDEFNAAVDDDRRRRTRATSRTSPASSSAARTGATASRGSSPTAATSPRRRTASGSRRSPTRTRLKGLQQLQDDPEDASNAPADAKDQTPWLYVNDTDVITDADGKVTGKTSPRRRHDHGSGLGALVDR